MTRSEIEQTLIEIVRQEKRQLPIDTLSGETLLAEAGIDSLDALTILFAVEEHFKISIPDDRARAIRTLGDMVDAVAALVPAS
jgi:acyl carrier protein